MSLLETSGLISQRIVGIDYETLRKINPSIIYCSIKGFGTKSPYADKPAYDIIVQAMSGLMMTTGKEGVSPLTVP